MGEVVGPVQDPPVGKHAAGADRPEEGHAELQGRLEPVRPERREQCRADGACAREYLQVFLRPLGAYTLLDVPMTELRGEAVDLAEVFGPEGSCVVERLRAESTWLGRFAVLDRLLLHRLSTGPRPAPEVARAWQLLQASGGSMPIGRIAAEVGWSHKHLITRVSQQIGLTPKTAARLIRSTGCCGGWTDPGGTAGRGPLQTPATPTSPT